MQKITQYKSTGPAPHLAGGRLLIDLNALAQNYRLLKQQAYPATVAGVVKADAYGLGIEPIVRTLWAEGCDTFFVALPHEGIQVRKILQDARIYVFNGLFGAEAAAAYREAKLIPVLNSPSDLSIWEAYGWDDETHRPCALHLETGMNRLGLPEESARHFAQENALTHALTPQLIITHLSCADEPMRPVNLQQLESFHSLSSVFSGIKTSIANSAGIFLGSDFHCDLVRPGIALYGAKPVSDLHDIICPVVTALTRIAQVKKVSAGNTVGYGATPVTHDTILAVCSTGYADGYHRAASNMNKPGGPKPVMGFINGKHVPVIGRVSMDLTLFDITALGENGANIGDHIELFGPNVAIENVAASCGTIPYELLTSLGQRYYREYVGYEI